MLCMADGGEEEDHDGYVVDRKQSVFMQATEDENQTLDDYQFQPGQVVYFSAMPQDITLSSSSYAYSAPRMMANEEGVPPEPGTKV